MESPILPEELPLPAGEGRGGAVFQVPSAIENARVGGDLSERGEGFRLKLRGSLSVHWK
jgi:hypothetical protein